jgi:hypothetical protein
MNKENVHFNSRRTSYDIYELDGDSYVFTGKGFANGWNAGDDSCIDDFISNNKNRHLA